MPKRRRRVLRLKRRQPLRRFELFRQRIVVVGARQILGPFAGEFAIDGIAGYRRVWIVERRELAAAGAGH